MSAWPTAQRAIAKSANFLEMARPSRSFLNLVKHKSAIRLFLEPFAIAIVLAFFVRAALRLYVIPSSSMAPTLLAGDHIVVTPYHFGSKPQPGDVIVFRSPRSTGELMVKRVIAEPGDLVETRDGRVVVRGHAIAEPYVAAQANSGAVSPQIVPADCYFVLGDNRADSLDSRSWGVLPRSAVLGRARMILWSSARGVGSGEWGVVDASSPKAQIGSRAPGVVAATPSSTPSRTARFFKLVQ